MCSILVVDDNPDYLDLVKFGISKIFSDIQFTEIHMAENGEEALDLYKQHLPEYVLTDFNMPGMSGEEFLQAIFSSDLRKPVKAWIMSNAYDLVVDLEGVGFIPKSKLLGSN